MFGSIRITFAPTEQPPRDRGKPEGTVTKQV